MDQFAFVWLIALVVFAVAELASPQLICIWFVLGSIVAFLAGLFGGPFWLQAVVFVLSSVLTLALTRPVLRRYLTVKKTSTNADRYIGQTAQVTALIDNEQALGEVKVFGLVWTARSVDGSVIPEGTTVMVERIEGVKLMVRVNGESRQQSAQEEPEKQKQTV